MRFSKYLRSAGSFSVLISIATLSAGCSTSTETRSARFLSAGKVWMEKRDYRRAVLQFRNAVQTNPKDPETHYHLGLACLYAADFQSALASVSRALELNPSYTAAKILKAQILSTSADASMVQAAEEMAESLVTASANPLAFDSLALAEIRLGKLDDAEKHLNAALERFPGHLSLSAKMAVVKLRQKDFAGAEQVLRDAARQAANSPAPLLALGNLFLMRGNPAAAEEQFRAASKIAPSDGVVLFYLAGTEYRLGRQAEATEALRRLADLPDEKYRSLRAVYLFQSGERRKAIEEFRRVYVGHRQDREALRHLVTAYAIAGRFRDALDVLGDALKESGSNLDARLLRARLYLHLGELEKAEAELTGPLSSSFQSAEAHYLEAAVFAARGQTRRRKKALAEVLELDPRNVTARLELAQLFLAEHAASAASGLLDETPADQRELPAIVLQRNWIRLSSRSEQREAEKDINLLLTKERIPEAVLQKAALAYWRKDYSQASALAAEVLKQKPADVRAMELVFKIHVTQNRTMAGVDELKNYASASKSPQALFFLGEVLNSMGDVNGARSAFERTLHADPNFIRAETELALLDQQLNQTEKAQQRLLGPAAKKDPVALLLLADLDYRAGNVEKAADGYRKVVDVDPENVSALNNLAFLLAQRASELDTALQLIQQAKVLEPDNPAVDDTLGWISYQKGNFKLAAAAFQRVVSRASTPRRLYHLAMAQFKAGNRAQGLEAFEKAYRLDPNLPEAAVALAAAKR